MKTAWQALFIKRWIIAKQLLYIGKYSGQMCVVVTARVWNQKFKICWWKQWKVMQTHTFLSILGKWKNFGKTAHIKIQIDYQWIDVIKSIRLVALWKFGIQLRCDRFCPSEKRNLAPHNNFALFSHLRFVSSPTSKHWMMSIFLSTLCYSVRVDIRLTISNMLNLNKHTLHHGETRCHR